MDRDIKKCVRLLDRGMACIGMIAEIEMKCKLLQRRISKANKSDDTSELPGFKQQVTQMQIDFDRYSLEIDEIREELHDYDHVFDGLA